jgi:hypothetical protein
MITQVKTGYNYINVSIACVDATGAVIDPTFAEAWFYRLNQSTGSLALDTNIDTDGKVTLTKQDSQTGFYGVGIPISTLTAGEYTVLYKLTISGISTVNVENFSIDESKKIIDDLNTSIGSGLSTKVDTIEAVTEEINQIQKGGRIMVSNQQIYYKDDNVTEIFRVSYYDQDGLPTIDDPFERRHS